jgi:hypothetical protein
MAERASSVRMKESVRDQRCGPRRAGERSIPTGYLQRADATTSPRSISVASALELLCCIPPHRQPTEAVSSIRISGMQMRSSSSMLVGPVRRTADSKTKISIESV